MTEINEQILDSIATKLEAAGLDDTERQLLDEVLLRASSFKPEVSGFGQSFSYTGLRTGANLAPMSFSIGNASGMLGGRGGMTEALTESRGYRTEA